MESKKQSGEYTSSSEEKLICISCDLELVPANVTVSYLDGSFPVELLRCPKCGYTYIPEDLAIGKILRVEKELEDK